MEIKTCSVTFASRLPEDYQPFEQKLEFQREKTKKIHEFWRKWRYFLSIRITLSCCRKEAIPGQGIDIRQETGFHFGWRINLMKASATNANTIDFMTMLRETSNSVNN